MARIDCRVRTERSRLGISQHALAAEAGLSRQALSALEAGRTVPGTDVALRLARALGTSVESLFALEASTPHLEARPVRGTAPRAGARVLLAQIDGGWVARPLAERGTEPSLAADAVVARARPGRVDAELLGSPESAAERLVVMGCAPTLGLLAARLARKSRPLQLAWVHGSSGEALDALEHKEVHLAGIHLRDARSGRYNVPHVERRFARQKMLIVNFASWEQGLVVARGNPSSIKSLDDLARPRVRWVAREPGAGATKLVEQSLRGTPKAPALVAHGHMEVAQAVAHGAADVGVAIRAAALAWNLDFLPLSAERFDLVIPRALADDERVSRLIDEVSSASFRREVESIGGYETGDSGDVVRA